MKPLGVRRYDLIAVVNGAVVMMLEIVGARFIQPYFGNSVYIWTAVIGVILGALSVGYWYGGRLADRAASDRHLGAILTVSAATLLVMLVTKDGLLGEIATWGSDTRWQALAAAIVLFGPVNFLLGLVSPYLAKLKLASLETAGRSIGNLYAAGTAGSILGTFITGFWLISWFGSRTLGLSLVIITLGLSFLAWRKSFLWLRLAIGTLTLVVGWVVPITAIGATGKVVANADSAYSHWQVVDFVREDGTLRYLTTDPSSAQSGILVGVPNSIPFDYLQRFVDTATVGEITHRHILVIGGGAYTLPTLLVAKFPEAQIDVVEIDPYLDTLAHDYFGYRDNPRIRIIHADARVFLNQTKSTYDLIYMDAFNAISPPFSLTTTEAVAQVQRIMARDGLVAVNLVARPGATFARAERAVYEHHFTNVRIGTVTPTAVTAGLQNLLMLASSSDVAVQTFNKLHLTDLPETRGGTTILTDDYAPVEQLTAP